RIRTTPRHRNVEIPCCRGSRSACGPRTAAITALPRAHSARVRDTETAVRLPYAGTRLRHAFGPARPAPVWESARRSQAGRSMAAESDAPHRGSESGAFAEDR